MAKKRIHEISKELGFPSSKDLIEKLHKAGRDDVKSHSSTIEVEEVRLILKQEEDARRARTDERRVSKGVIRRRPKGAVVRRPGAAADRVQREDTPAPPEASAEEIEAAPETPPESAPAEAAVEAEPVEVTAEAAAEAPEPPAEDAPAETAEAEVKAEGEEPAQEPKKARAARPDRRQRDETYDEDDDKPDIQLEEFGLSEQDFAGDDRENKDVRVAPPPPSTTAAQKKEDEQKSKVLRRIDPSVLKARLEVSKRPEPPKEWGRQALDMPASPMTELVVRTDASGKRRELVDVRKEAAKGRTGRAQKRREEMSAKDLLEHRRGQVYYPSPGRKRVKGRKAVAPRKTETVSQVPKRPIEIGETIIVADLAKQMSRKATEIIGWLIRQGMMVTINDPIPFDAAASLADEWGYEVTSTAFDEEKLLEGEAAETTQEVDPDAELRAPVVTVMGHVDHGKTTLLDHIRNANVAEGEAGGITQRIAGYQVKTSKGMITFLDTPGHAAFTAMRARGADVTDIIILVVAADDGVMPQTIEAIQHAKAAKVPIIVAVNKIDKPEANPDRVLQQLSQHEVLVEEWGGDVLRRNISAKTGDGIEDLLEQVALQAEIMELKANPKLPARGTVVEAQIDKGRGAVATVLVQEGTLSVGDPVVVGESYGKIRAMHADGGKKVKTALPSQPVQILGLDGVPQPGDELRTAKSVDDAREIAAFRREKRRSAEHAGQAKVSLQDLFSRMQTGEQKELKIVVKADVQGSVEAIREALVALSGEKVRVTVIHGGVGAITESDVEFATASDAIIVGFGVRPDTNALKAARANGVDIRTHKVIYEAVDEVRLAMQGLLAPVEREKYLGRAEIRQTFSVPKVGTVAGCAVVDGVVSRSAQIRVIRDGRSIYEGRLSSLKRFKDDVREVKEGLECGMGIERFNDIKEGDIIEAFEIVQVQATLDGPSGASGAPGSEARV